MIVKLYINHRKVLKRHPNFQLLYISCKFNITLIHELLLIF